MDPPVEDIMKEAKEVTVGDGANGTVSKTEVMDNFPLWDHLSNSGLFDNITLGQILNIPPKRKTKPRAKRVPKKKPVEPEPSQLVPKTYEEIMREGWDFQKFISELNVPPVPLHEQFLVWTKNDFSDRLRNFRNSITPSSTPNSTPEPTPGPSPSVEPLPNEVISPNQALNAILWTHNFGIPSYQNPVEPENPLDGVEPVQWHN